MTSQIAPVFVTDTVRFDSDDPAIWINPVDVSRSLILGTDKIEEQGGIFVFDLEGRIVRSIDGLDRPNNIDIAYDFILGTDTVDIAVVTERARSMLRVLRVPEMDFIDNGGIPVFESTNNPQPMGVGLYTRKEDGKIYAILSRKENPVNENDYLWQYELNAVNGTVEGTKVREFGRYNGSEVEAIAVDNELGFVYYSDEGYGIRKYWADPLKEDNSELAVFGTEGFTEDHEGISIYKGQGTAGYILVSDQAANEFHVFPREGTEQGEHDHPLLKIVKLSTQESDGSEVTSIPLNDSFPKGMFVAMSDDKTFHLYSWEEMMPD